MPSFEKTSSLCQGNLPEGQIVASSSRNAVSCSSARDDAAGNVVEAYEQTGEFKEPMTVLISLIVAVALVQSAKSRVRF
jgi:hypothetical protein